VNSSIIKTEGAFSFCKCPPTLTKEFQELNECHSKHIYMQVSEYMSNLLSVPQIESVAKHQSAIQTQSIKGYRKQ